MARTKRKINPILPETVPAGPEGRVYHAGGYIRLSVEDGGKPGADTLEAQKALVCHYISSQPDMEFCGLFCDNGQTGTNFDRPGFEALMESVRSGKIDCVVVKDLSRFGRNYKEAGNYLERVFPLLGIRFVAVDDGFDTRAAECSQDGYIVPLKNIVNEAYSRDISRKIRSALEVKRRNGEFTGSWAPYGYRKRGDGRRRLEPNEETAPIVRKIFQWRVSGLGYQRIARKLNERGIPSPGRYHYLNGETQSARYAGSKWSAAAVRKILTSQVYLGRLVQGRTRSGLLHGRREEKTPEAEWSIVRDAHEALIDEETFQSVQKMVTARTRHGRREAPPA